MNPIPVVGVPRSRLMPNLWAGMCLCVVLDGYVLYLMLVLGGLISNSPNQKNLEQRNDTIERKLRYIN